MAFHDLTFLFTFFPVMLLLHAVLPKKGRNILLLLGSLVFFAWGNPEYLLLMVCLLLFNYFTGVRLAGAKAEGNTGKGILISAVAVNLLLLGFFKYWGFLLENVNGIFGSKIPVRQLPMPIGVSFFIFSILSYLFDIYRDKAPAADNLMTFSLYVLAFPKLVSGPIVQYQQMEEQLHQRTVSLAKAGKGVRLFLVGLAKKVLLSNMLGNTFYAVTALPAGNVSVVTAWLGTLSYGLMLYFDFSGYSDMAIGMAEIFGFHFEKNFDYPYLSKSLTEFWRRWHISLGAWFRDYVYIPLGGSREGTGKTVRNLLIVWLLTGIWHGASWNFIFWGAYFGGLLLLEKFVFKDFAQKLPDFLGHLFTLVLVFVGWVFFFSPSLGSAFSWLGKMFGIGASGFLDGTARYYLGGSVLLIAVSVFACTPMATTLGNRVYRRGGLALAMSVIWFEILLLLCIAGMMNSTYSSFLYVQF